ncbi:MAG: hypothetical protein KYX62_09835 [Pseudomonadota bacterium]|nr:hypothetical protein [Pseudomonadota bacterium]
MITEWVPAASGQADIDVSLLQQSAALAETLKSDADAVRKVIGDDTLLTMQSWLKLPESAWQAPIQALPEKDLFPLAVFFTLAENAFSGWQCGSSNPAIWIFRYLKAQHALPEKPAIKALKSLTDNRYIPYGSAL